MRDPASLLAAVQHLTFAVSDLAWAAFMPVAYDQELKIASALKQIGSALNEINEKAETDA